MPIASFHRLYLQTHGAYLELVIPGVRDGSPKWQMYDDLVASVNVFFQPATGWKKRVESV